MRRIGPHGAGISRGFGYRRTLQAYCERLKDHCTRRGVNYMFTSTSVPFDQIILNYFRQRGLVR